MLPYALRKHLNRKTISTIYKKTKTTGFVVIHYFLFGPWFITYTRWGNPVLMGVIVALPLIVGLLVSFYVFGMDTLGRYLALIVMTFVMAFVFRGILVGICLILAKIWQRISNLAQKAWNSLPPDEYAAKMKNKEE